MPKDNVYPFKGPMLGNDATCTAQAFALNFAHMSYIPCNAWLAIYYICVLVLKLKSSTISRYIEPFFYLISLVLSIVGSWIFQKYEYYNVDPLMPHCYTARYPFHCTWFPGGEECYDNGSFLYTEKGYSAMNWAILGYLYVVFGLLILCMLTIIVNTFLFERRNRLGSTSAADSSTPRNSDEPNNSDNSRVDARVSSSDLKFTRIVSFQATLYILAFFITWTPTTITLGSDSTEEGIGVYMREFLQGFEGFFILCIFLYHKVHNLRRSKNRSNMPLRDALKIVFLSREDRDDFFLENITMVQLEIDEIHQRREAADQAEMDLENEESVDSKPDTADLEKYEGISFASPEASFVVSSTGEDAISYDVSKFSGQSAKSGSQSSRNKDLEHKSHADESSC
ncbi:predicted protein [Chaetoceros tenuissimus]|uniref:G-protein coupled receptors family 1 profile domain-containing protein n=1 Tax=Chaetoceros tenuissimus TaxID=426638 RepID=A0AAD3CD46_9STRA|nr:predicted protein [Chaetoceros tenuissimus]